MTDADAAVEGHVAALEDAGSYLVEFNASAVSSNRTVQISTLQAANLTDERAYAVTTVADGANRTQFYADDAVYVREDAPGEEPTYSSRSQPFEPRNFTGVTTVEPLVRNVAYGNATVRERDGAGSTSTARPASTTSGRSSAATTTPATSPRSTPVSPSDRTASSAEAPIG